MKETSLYIHIPYCASKCHYCSFAVVTGKDHSADDYLSALLEEADQYAGMSICSVFIGGGTPSHLKAGHIERLIKGLRQKFQIAQNAEITIEANPHSFDRAKARTLKELGINRASLGIQSLDDRLLRYLGRIHNALEAMESFEILKATGFDAISVDLMFSIPGQTHADLIKDAEKMAALGSDHLSLYNLNIEENSRFSKRRVDQKCERDQIDEYFDLKNTLAKHNYHQYEISNFAKPACESKHNIHYWRGGNYIGLGMSAHSHIDGHRYWNTSKLEVYMHRALAGEQTKSGEEHLSARMRLAETFLFGLRMNAGSDLSGLEAKYGTAFDGDKKAKLDEFIKGGFLTKDDGRYRATDKGQLLLDELSANLV